PSARPLSNCTLIGERHLESRIDRFRAGIREKYAIKVEGNDRGQLLGQLEGNRMSDLERRRVIKCRKLALYRFGDSATTMPRIDAPEPGRAVEYVAPVAALVVHAGC